MSNSENLLGFIEVAIIS